MKKIIILLSLILISFSVLAQQPYNLELSPINIGKANGITTFKGNTAFPLRPVNDSTANAASTEWVKNLVAGLGSSLKFIQASPTTPQGANIDIFGWIKSNASVTVKNGTGANDPQTNIGIANLTLRNTTENLTLSTNGISFGSPSGGGNMSVGGIAFGGSSGSYNIGAGSVSGSSSGGGSYNLNPGGVHTQINSGNIGINLSSEQLLFFNRTAGTGGGLFSNGLEFVRDSKAQRLLPPTTTDVMNWKLPSKAGELALKSDIVSIDTTKLVRINPATPQDGAVAVSVVNAIGGPNRGTLYPGGFQGTDGVGTAELNRFGLNFSVGGNNTSLSSEGGYFFNGVGGNKTIALNQSTFSFKDGATAFTLLGHGQLQSTDPLGKRFIIGTENIVFESLTAKKTIHSNYANAVTTQNEWPNRNGRIATIGDIQDSLANHSGGSSYTFNNGLVNSNGTVGLGGSLSQSTILDVSGDNSLTLSSTVDANSENFLSFSKYDITLGTNKNISGINDGYTLSVSSSGVSLGRTKDFNEQALAFRSTNDIVLRDQLFNKGIVYDGDYGANFTDRSLVDKQYVDSLFTTSSGGGGNSRFITTVGPEPTTGNGLFLQANKNSPYNSADISFVSNGIVRPFASTFFNDPNPDIKPYSEFRAVNVDGTNPTSLTLTAGMETDDKTLIKFTANDRGGFKLARVQGGYPMLSNDFTTKDYVDNKVTNLNFDNGITKTGNTARLGGDGTWDFPNFAILGNISGMAPNMIIEKQPVFHSEPGLYLATGNGAVDISNSKVSIGVESNAIDITATGNGAFYRSDKSANWTTSEYNNVLVSKKYVDDQIAANSGGGDGTPLTFINGLKKTNDTVSIGGNASWNFDHYISMYTGDFSGSLYNELTLANDRFDVIIKNNGSYGRFLIDYTGTSMSQRDTTGKAVALQLGTNQGASFFVDEINNHGLDYYAKYRTNLSPRWLTDKEYVDSAIVANMGGGGSPLTFNNGLVNTNGTVGLGGNAYWIFDNNASFYTSSFSHGMSIQNDGIIMDGSLLNIRTQDIRIQAPALDEGKTYKTLVMDEDYKIRTIETSGSGSGSPYRSFAIDQPVSSTGVHELNYADLTYLAGIKNPIVKAYKRINNGDGTFTEQMINNIGITITRSSISDEPIKITVTGFFESGYIMVGGNVITDSAPL